MCLISCCDRRNNDHEEEPSIFVNHIPENVDVARLLEVFSKFGDIKNGDRGIKLKLQRGKDNYAFIDFEAASAVEKALASPPLLEGKQVMFSRVSLVLLVLGVGKSQHVL
jgi:RNA recognition motif-containing protein